MTPAHELTLLLASLLEDSLLLAREPERAAPLERSAEGPAEEGAALPPRARPPLRRA